MKRLLITSIAILSIANGAIFYMSNNDNGPTVPSMYIEPIEVVETTEEPIETITVETPVVEDIAPEPVIENVIEPIEEVKVIPSFSDLQFKYILIRRSTDLSAFFVSLSNIYPDKFTPDNIENTFEYINNLFDSTNPEWTDRSFGESPERLELLSGNYNW